MYYISGNPEKPVIENMVERPRPGIFKLFWTVNTHKKITECTVFHRSRKVNFDHFCILIIYKNPIKPGHIITHPDKICTHRQRK